MVYPGWDFRKLIPALCILDFLGCCQCTTLLITKCFRMSHPILKNSVRGTRVSWGCSSNSGMRYHVVQTNWYKVLAPFIRCSNEALFLLVYLFIFTIN
jgi:hypothetical protein